jgi:hypothetical protein
VLGTSQFWLSPPHKFIASHVEITSRLRAIVEKAYSNSLNVAGRLLGSIVALTDHIFFVECRCEKARQRIGGGRQLLRLMHVESRP